MKFHICSDLHLDYNKNDFSGNEPSNFLREDCYNLIAGDLSGYDNIRHEWLDQQIQAGKIGAYVVGNHDFIYQPHKDKKPYSQFLKDEANKYGAAPITFLDNNYVYFPDEDIVIWGATFWTDCKYGMGGNESINGYFLEHAMNDYRFEIFPRKGGGLRRASWEDFVHLHYNSLSSLTKCLEEHPHSRFVVLTHHAPSGKSIPICYKGEDSNCGYVSPLEDFILEHPQIKLWVHGHIHSPNDYEVGDCRIISNPFGYRRHYEDTQYQPDLILEV